MTMGEFTMDQRLKWYYDVARLKGAPLTDRDRQRLDDYETLLRIEGGDEEGCDETA